MQASTAAFGTAIGGNDVVVDHTVTVRLPVFRTNLIPNPNFEYGLTGWIGTSGAVFTQTATHPFVGDHCMLVTWATGAAGQAVVISFDAGGGTIVHVQVAVFVPTGSPAVQLLGSGGGIGTTSTVTNAWQVLTMTYVNEFDGGASCWIQTAGASTSGQQCYVDAWIAEGDVAGFGSYFDGDSLADLNICADPSFEQPILPEWWTPAGCTVAQDATWATDGDYSCAITPSSASTASYIAAGGDYAAGKMRSGLVAGNTYTVSADMNVPVALTGASSAQAGMIVIFWDVGAGFVIGAHSAAGPVAGGTQRMVVTATIPANATAAGVWLTNGYGNTAANVVRWDSVLIRRAASDTAFFGGQRPGSNLWTGAPGNSASKLYVDPYPDATLAVESVTVERQMVTDMPDGTRLITGYPSATATVVLSGNMDPTDETTDAAAVFAPYNPASPTYHSDPLDSPVTIQQGIYDGAGSELYTTFTGGVDDCAVDNVAGTATLTCLDGRNKLRTSVTMPSIAYLFGPGGGPYDTAPGLTGSWVLDYLLRQNGLYTSPPPRASCLFYASMSGSAWPQVMGAASAAAPGPGVLMANDVLLDVNTGLPAGTPSDFMAEMGPGIWNQQVVHFPVLTGIPLAGGATLSANSGGGFYFEGWVYADNSFDTSLRPCHLAFTSGALSNFSQVGIQWDWSPGAATVTTSLFVNRFAAGYNNKPITGAAISTNHWHHVAILVALTGTTTATVTSTIDGVTTVNSITGLFAAASEPALVTVDFEWPGMVDTIQVTNEKAPTPIGAFYPTAYLDASLNALIATVDTTGQDPWELIQLLAEAEQGVSGLDERNTFRFRNRANLLAAQPVRSVTSAASLKTLATDVGKSTLANTVTASVNALAVGNPATVWSASSVIGVGAHSTVSMLVSTDNPVLATPSFDFGYNSGGVIPGETSWRAAVSAGGGAAVTTNINVTTASVSPSTLRITLVNHNAFPIYFVSPTGISGTTPGTPWLNIGGQFVTAPATGVVATSSWQPSIDSRGQVALALPDNVWRQDATSTQGLTDDQVADLYRPRPLLTNVTIVADPRLQLTDRVTLVDPDGSHMDDDVVLSGIVLTDSATDWTQAITARGVSSPGDWIMGLAGRSETGETTYT